MRQYRTRDSPSDAAAVRGLREAVQHRCKLVALRSGLKAKVHAILARQGATVPVSDMFSPGGRQLLDQLRLDPPFAARALSLLRLIDAFTFEIDTVTRRLTADLGRHPEHRRNLDGREHARAVTATQERCAPQPLSRAPTGGRGIIRSR